MALVVRRAPGWLQRVLVATAILLVVGGRAGAQEGRRESAYDGLQLAPSLHFAFNRAHLRGGLGVDLGVNRWLYLDAWGSRVSRPNYEHGYPGAWQAGLAVNGRVAWRTQAFVYGAGLVYTSAFHCPRGCTVLSFSLDEHRVAYDLVAAQARFGYDVRFADGWFARALASFDVPFAKSHSEHVAPGVRYDYDVSPFALMHGSMIVSLGYAFPLRP